MALSEKHLVKKNALLVAYGIANDRACSHSLRFLGAGPLADEAGPL